MNPHQGHPYINNSTISLSNEKGSSILNPSIVKQLSRRTKNFAILHAGAPVADNIGLKGGQTSNVF